MTNTRQVEQVRSDFATIQNDLGFIVMRQLARLPTRGQRDQQRRPNVTASGGCVGRRVDDRAERDTQTKALDPRWRRHRREPCCGFRCYVSDTARLLSGRS